MRGWPEVSVMVDGWDVVHRYRSGGWSDAYEVTYRKVNDYVVAFEVLELSPVLGGEPAMWVSGYGVTRNRAEAETLCSGSVKWDGCSDTGFPLSVHFCDRDGLSGLGALLSMVWAQCQVMMGESSDWPDTEAPAQAMELWGADG